MTIGLSAVCDLCDKPVFCPDGTSRNQFIDQLRRDGWYVNDDTNDSLCPTCTLAEEHNADLGTGPKWYPMPGEN